MARRTAWGENVDQLSQACGDDGDWSPDTLSDQFQKALKLCEQPEDSVDGSSNEEETLPCEEDSSNDHNKDVNRDGQQEEASRTIAEPYKNKYMARVLLVEMKAALSKQLDRLTTEQQNQCVGLCLQERLLAVSLELGLVAVSVQEPSTGEEHFSHVVQSLTHRASSPRCVLLLVSAHNQLGLLWGERLENAKAKIELLKASEIYNQYKDSNSCQAPISIQDLFLQVEEEDEKSENVNQSKDINVVTVSDEGGASNEDQSSEAAGSGGQLESKAIGRWSDLEHMHTYTLFYLAQVSGHLGESADSARYCHATLHRQLADTMVFTPLEWSKNAATLSEFYTLQGSYKTARYLLSAAWTVLTSNAPPSAMATSAHSHDVKMSNEQYASTVADVAKLFGNYCLALLRASQTLAEGETDEAEPKVANPSDAAAAQWEQKSFVGLNSESVERIEGEVLCEPVKDYDGARRLFLVGLRHYQEAAAFYTLEDHASTHTETKQCISRLYQCLAYFEPDLDRQSKMHKRRVDLLTVLLEELNQQYYLQACRQLRYELAETLAVIAKCKEEGAAAMGTSEQQRDKINTLITSSISSYQLFLNSYNSTDGGTPSPYPEESERAMLVAHFHQGRLWNRINAPLRRIEINNISNAINCFKRLVDYVAQHPKSAERVADELPLCREMVQLLPIKLNMLRSRV